MKTACFVFSQNVKQCNTHSFLKTLKMIFIYLRNNSWVAGEHEGVVMTCGDQLTHDLKVINPRNGTVDPHYHCGRTNNIPTEQPKQHGFVSLTVTTALCKNIQSCWNSLIKKHLNEDR